MKKPKKRQALMRSVKESRRRAREQRREETERLFATIMPSESARALETDLVNSAKDAPNGLGDALLGLAGVFIRLLAPAKGLDSSHGKVSRADAMALGDRLMARGLSSLVKSVAVEKLVANPAASSLGDHVDRYLYDALRDAVERDDKERAETIRAEIRAFEKRRGVNQPCAEHGIPGCLCGTSFGG